MAKERSISIALSPELAEFLETRVATGRYSSPSEVIQQALHLLEERERDREAALEDVRQKIVVGLEQARRGELRDGEAVFEELERRSRTGCDGDEQAGSS